MITLSPASPIQTLDQNKGRCPSRTFPQSRFADPSHPEVLSEPPGWVQTDPAITPSDPYPPHQSGRDDLAPPLSGYPRGRAPARNCSAPFPPTHAYPIENTPGRNGQYPHTSTQPVPVHSQSHTRHQAAEGRRINIAATNIFSSRRAYAFSAKPIAPPPTDTASNQSEKNAAKHPQGRDYLRTNIFAAVPSRPSTPHAKDTQITTNNKGSLTPWKDRLSPVPQTPTILPRNPRR